MDFFFSIPQSPVSMPPEKRSKLVTHIQDKVDEGPLWEKAVPTRPLLVLPGSLGWASPGCLGSSRVHQSHSSTPKKEGTRSSCRDPPHSMSTAHRGVHLVFDRFALRGCPTCGPRMAVNAAHHKIIHLLKTSGYFFDYMLQCI